MAKVLSLWLLVMVIAITAQATTYSCRDKQGKLYITDNLQSLPAECRGQTQKVKSEDPDNLNYVPAQTDPQGSGDQFLRAVRDTEREQKQKKARGERLVKRAEQLVAQYKQAIQDKNNATRRWSYASRGVIQKADEVIESAREGKRQLLTEIDRANISRENEEKIVSWLDEIAN